LTISYSVDRLKRSIPTNCDLSYFIGFPNSEHAIVECVGLPANDPQSLAEIYTLVYFTARHLCILPIQYGDDGASAFVRGLASLAGGSKGLSRSLADAITVTPGHARGEKKQFNMRLRISDGRFRFDENYKGMGFLDRFLQAHLSKAVLALPLHLAQVHKDNAEFLLMAGNALNHCLQSYPHGINPGTVDSVAERAVQYAWMMQGQS
jgi:hypothetical protein